MKCDRTIMSAAFVAALFSGGAQAQDAVRVANEGAIRDAWAAAPGSKFVAPGYPAAFASRADEVCLALGYRIGPDGKTSEFILLKAWNSASGEHEPVAGFWDAFSQAAAAAVGQWQFAPKAGVDNPRPVDTVATLTFGGTGDQASLRAHCRIGDLASFLEQAKLQRARRGDMNRHQLDRTYQESQRNQMRSNQAARGNRGG